MLSQYEALYCDGIFVKASVHIIIDFKVAPFFIFDRNENEAVRD